MWLSGGQRLFVVHGSSIRPEGLEPVRRNRPQVHRPSGGDLTQYQALPIDFQRSSLTKGLMWSFLVIEMEVLRQRFSQFVCRLVVLQIGFLVLHRPPQTLDENIVHAPAFAIHADFHIVLFQHFRKRLAGELRALVAVEASFLETISEEYQPFVFIGGLCNFASGGAIYDPVVGLVRLQSAERQIAEDKKEQEIAEKCL